MERTNKQTEQEEQLEMERYTMKKLEEMKKEAEKKEETYQVMLIEQEIEKKKEEQEMIQTFKRLSPYGVLREYEIQTQNGVYFSEAGLGRLYMTIGYIQGKLDTEEPTEEAIGLCKGFLRALSMYSLTQEKEPQMFESAWEKVSTDRYVPSVPKRMIAYTDDNSFGSFGFALYERTKEPNTIKNPLEVDVLGVKVFYRFYMNGGLIFHSHSQSWSYHS